MNSWSEQQRKREEKEKESKDKEKTSRETLGKYFYDLSKLTDGISIHWLQNIKIDRYGRIDNNFHVNKHRNCFYHNLD